MKNFNSEADQSEGNDDYDAFKDDDDLDPESKSIIAILKKRKSDDDDTPDDIKNAELADYTQWKKIGKNTYIPSGPVVFETPCKPGIYRILYHRDWGHYLSHKDVALDELFTLPQPEQKLILNDIRTFWDRKEAFKKYKYTYKRGILLYGSPGNGKSSIINLLALEIVEKHNGVVFFVNSPAELETFCSFVPQVFKQIQPDTPLLCVLEDLETLTKHYDTEILLLNTLDGANQMDNIVFLGCTNYPEELKERVTNRPSRFDRRYYLGPPTAEVRKVYFEKKLKEDDLKNIDIDKWVKETDGLSIAHLGELVKSVFCLGDDFDSVIKKFEEMKQKISSASFGKEEKSIGFSNR